MSYTLIMSLERELKTFEANKEKLLAEKQGRFVLIKRDKIISDFASYEDALADGYKRFGNQEFFIEQVLESGTINSFTRDI